MHNRSYSIAKNLDINHIIYHSNFIPEYCVREDWLEKSIKFWKEFLADKGNDINIYIENFVDNDPDLLCELYDKINDIRIKICLDIGYANCNSKVDIVDWINILGERIGHVHLHNNNGNWDNHWDLYKGTVDMEDTIKLLESTRYNMTYTIEADYIESIKFLKEKNLIK